MTRQKSNVINIDQPRAEARRRLLERLFSEHGSALRAFLRVRLDVQADMEDIVQEVFLRLERMEGLQNRVHKESDRDRAFMMTIANNLILDLERSKRVRISYAEKEKITVQLEGSTDAASPEAIAATRQELDWLKKEILKLKPSWQRAFVLNRFHHKSYRDIADEMGVSVSQVEKYMMGALKEIRRAAKRARGESES